MNLNLGKIFLLLIIPLISFAGSVSAKLSQSIIYKGDMATLILTAEGKNIKFPEITEIGTSSVLSSSSSQSTTIINGEYTHSSSKTYIFKPTESMVIPVYSIEVDGKEEMTAPLTLKVTKPSPASKNASVKLEMKVSKKSAYVGEPLTLDVLFKTLPNAHYDKVELSELKLKDFWIKKLPNVRTGVDGNYTTQGYRYIIFPQQEGNFTLSAPFAQLGKIVQARGRRGNDFFNDPFFNSMMRQMKWSKLYANELQIEVKPLPNGLDVFGDFSLRARVDKKRVEANKPVNLTLEIKGEGNLEDIKKIELNIPNTVIYSDEPKLYPNPGGVKGVFEQKIAIIADRNFTIPSIEFSFFDAKSQAKKTVSTKPIDIIVTGGKSQQVVQKIIEQKASTTTKSNEVEEKDNIEKIVVDSTPISKKSKILWYALGVLSGIILTILSFMGRKKLRTKRKREIPLIKEVAKAKDDKALFRLLLPYRDDDRVIKEALHKLEKNIYGNGSEIVDREELIEILEELL